MTSEWFRMDIGRQKENDMRLVASYIDAKRPHVMTPVVAFVGQVGAGKSAMMNHAVGAYIQTPSSPVGYPTVMKGLTDTVFRRVCGYSEAEVSSSVLWPVPRQKVENLSCHVPRGSHNFLFKPLSSAALGGADKISFRCCCIQLLRGDDYAHSLISSGPEGSPTLGYRPSWTG